MQTTDDLFLPDPLPREVKYTVISVDDHVVEPPHTFEGRLPAHLQDRAPKIVETPEGHQVWEFEGNFFTQVGMNAIAGRRPETVKLEPFRFEHMRASCYDPAARVVDMDINGVYAAVNFPSMITGFAGRVFYGAQDGELGAACTRAWNDWIHDEWLQPFPDRFIGLGVAYLADPQQAADEIRRNAERGFTTVSMPERPHKLGLPSLWDRDHWDPIIAACDETDTVISIHVASSGGYESAPGAPGLQLGATLFGQLSLAASAEWLWSEYPVKHPDLKIAMSEGGIGWVAMLLDRLDNIIDRSGYGMGWDIRPAEVLKRNFWFCTLDDPSTIDTRYRIGVENIMVEVDFPHGDGTWPDTQLEIEKYWGHIPDDELRMMCSENAAKLYRHPLPDVVLPRASAFVPTRDRLAPELTTREEIVLLARALWNEGYNDHLSGHITVNLGDGTFLCNPWLLTWEEFGPDDVIRIDLDGNVLEGDWPAPLGIPIHLELHRARPGVGWAVHGHTHWGSVWSAMKRVPPLHDQTGAGGGGTLVLVDEYGGGVSNVASAKDAIERLGDADMAILAHHGVLLTAKNVNAAYWRAVSLEWRCRLALLAETGGGGAPVPQIVHDTFGRSDGTGFVGYWETAVRRELRRYPDLAATIGTAANTAG